ncbi:MAG: nucleotidyl transferase AbiEii/AbiGii toxin family protein [Actinobacteria bacterium]|nr:nucleotidyl transferase AbiEii/AbiGii toxin family protein [Actinomycetota bacterium]
MLSPLQEQVAAIIAGLEEAEDFVLAGGAALIVRGDVHRQTRDLDFFGLTADAVDQLLPAVDRALREAGLTVHRVQEAPGFARLVVESADDRTELDLAADARLFPAEPGRLAPMLSGEELAVDKMLAVFGRAEARDFIDLMAIESRYGFDRLCRLAAEKDRGFTPAVLAAMLGQFRRLGREEFELDDARFEQLSRDVERWRERAIQLAHPPPDLGLEL